MDEIVSSLSSSFSVSNTPNDPNAPHPRFSQYKKVSRPNEQEERRRRFLEEQKEKRHDYVLLARRLAGFHTENEEVESADHDGDETPEDTPMDYKAASRQLHCNRKYRNQLMLSEWLVDVPPDFSTNWLAVPCPVGKRNLIVASKGQTKSYSKAGVCVNKFSSQLPGGQLSSKKEYSLLDCIFVEQERTFYVLDLMCWKSHVLFREDTEFRFFWLQSRFQDCPGLAEMQPYKFVPLSSHPTDSESILKAIRECPFSEMDGLLFYHRRAIYHRGPTPLVGWLKPDMVPEALGLPLPKAPATVDRLAMLAFNADQRDRFQKKTKSPKSKNKDNVDMKEEEEEEEVDIE